VTAQSSDILLSVFKRLPSSNLAPDQPGVVPIRALRSLPHRWPRIAEEHLGITSTGDGIAV
jgi:hypothetical protein